MKNLVCNKCGLDPSICLCPNDILISSSSSIKSDIVFIEFDGLVPYINKTIEDLNKLAEVSTTPIYYYGQVEGLQKVLTYIYKNSK